MNAYKTLTKEMLSAYADTLRRSRRLTQEKMAESLRISSRAYSDLERGKHCFSTITLLFLLLILKEEERKELLDTFQSRVDALENSDAA